MPLTWEVIGGTSTGGIVVRKGKPLGSEAEAERLSTGALVTEEELDGNRLRYRRLTGTGPPTGWVSVLLKDKVLLRQAEKHEDLTLTEKSDRVTPPAFPAAPKKSEGTSQTSDSVASSASSPALANGIRPRAAVTTGATLPQKVGASHALTSVADSRNQRLQSKLQESLDALERPVKALLRIRSAIESGSAGSAQHARLHDMQQQLVKALMRVQAAADELDPPLITPSRMKFQCATPGCPYLVHSREGLGGFCCTACHKFSQKPLTNGRGGYQAGSASALQRWRGTGYTAANRPYRSVLPGNLQAAALPAVVQQEERHEARCECRRAPSGSTPANRHSKPMDSEQLAELELDEAIRLIKARAAAAKQKTGMNNLENTWLEANPKWSQSGVSAVGKWASSIVHDEWGDPNTHGPSQLLEGGVWISRKGCTADQWLVFDLGSQQLVSEVRARGNHTCTRYNARNMHWQAGDSMYCSNWRTVASFTCTQDSNWVVKDINPPVKSRWWRLFISSNYGDKDYVWICGFGIRQIWKGTGEKPPDRETNAEKNRKGTGEKPPDRETNAEKKGKGTGEKTHAEKKEGTHDAKSQKARKAEKEAEEPHKKLTNSDLRQKDSSWQALRGFQKLLVQALLSDRLLYFEDKPYIDYKQQRAEDYAEAFLQQTAEQGWSLDYDPNFFCELAYEGFNPISVEIASDADLMIQVLSLCFEPGRHVVECLDVHISKNVKKRAKNYTMTIDTAYDDVMLGCIRQHGEAWLYRGQRWLHRKLREDGYTGRKNISFAMHSIELWDESGQLVAGDLGYTMGGVYVSQTGFHQDGTAGAGEAQLVLAAALLHKMGHSWFDLGQANVYKAALGAMLLDRLAWLERFRAARDQTCHFAHEPIGGQELMDHLLRAMTNREAVCNQGPAPGLRLLAPSSAYEADASWSPGAAWEHCMQRSGSQTCARQFVLHQEGQRQATGMSYLLTLPIVTETEGAPNSTSTWDNVCLPLVVYFHGAIEPSDNIKEVPLVLHVQKVLDESQFGRGSADPFIGLAPFCPVNMKDKRRTYWFKTCDSAAYEDWDLSGATRCQEMELSVIRVLAQVCSELPVDASRVYFVGSSVGGYAALRLAEFVPLLPAAVVTMSAYYPEMPQQGHSVAALAEKLQNVPRVWPLHCRFDTTVPVDLPHVANLHEQLRKRCKAEVEWVPAVVALAPEADYHSSHRRIFLDPAAFFREILQSCRPDMRDPMHKDYLDQQLMALDPASKT